MTDDLVARLRSYIPQGDGWNSEFANTLDEAANAIEASRDALIEEPKAGLRPCEVEPVAVIRTGFKLEWCAPDYGQINGAAHPDGTLLYTADQLATAHAKGREEGLRAAAAECQSYIIERGDSVVACGGIRCRDRIMALLSDH